MIWIIFSRLLKQMQFGKVMLLMYVKVIKGYQKTSFQELFQKGVF